MKSFLSIHYDKVVITLCSLAAALALNLYFGGIKPWGAITWVDIFGEGSVLLMASMILIFILNTRPKGKVTNYLFYGCLCFCISVWQDVLDEMIALESHYVFDNLIESIIAPIGIFTLGYGIFRWNEEQQVINKMLLRRERFYREHSALDFVTDLYTSVYMEQQIKRELGLAHSQPLTNSHPMSLILLDIDQFDTFNRHYGDHEGDRVLKQVADIIVMNIRSQDLACRYAGDRFIVLLPDTELNVAETIGNELMNALGSLAFKPSGRDQSKYLNFTHACIDHSEGDETQQLLHALNRMLEFNKENKRVKAA